MQNSLSQNLALLFCASLISFFAFSIAHSHTKFGNENHIEATCLVCDILTTGNSFVFETALLNTHSSFTEATFFIQSLPQFDSIQRIRNRGPPAKILAI